MINDKGYINSDLLYESGSYNNEVGYCQYIKFSDGTLIQAGDFGAISLKPGGSQNVTCNLKIPFVDDKYFAICGQNVGGTYNTSLVENVQEQHTNRLIITIWNTNTGNIANLERTCWVAIGKWK